MNKRNRVIRLGGLTLVALGLLLGLNLSTIHAPVITAAGVPDPAITLYGHEYAFEVTPGSPEHVFRFEISNPGNIQIYATWRRPATASQLEFFLDAYDARGRLLHSHQKATVATSKYFLPVVQEVTESHIEKYGKLHQCTYDPKCPCPQKVAFKVQEWALRVVNTYRDGTARGTVRVTYPYPKGCPCPPCPCP